MKTIREIAGKRAGCTLSCITQCETFDTNEEKKACCNRLERRGFINGVRYAERWISVEEEMPEDGIYVLTKRKREDNFEYIFLNKTTNGKWDWNAPDTSRTTHWRPVEHK